MGNITITNSFGISDFTVEPGKGSRRWRVAQVTSSGITSRGRTIFEGQGFVAPLFVWEIKMDLTIPRIVRLNEIWSKQQELLSQNSLDGFVGLNDRQWRTDAVAALQNSRASLGSASIDGVNVHYTRHRLNIIILPEPSEQVLNPFMGDNALVRVDVRIEEVA
ncbi:MAG: hypothetical protein HC918_13695 [Oscillatoriales cyanobacterium SM2_1_8]|nr:hypothetical protein [Oscillatoriales cyanobacterium SM2_1_8]